MRSGFSVLVLAAVLAASAPAHGSDAVSRCARAFLGALTGPRSLEVCHHGSGRCFINAQDTVRVMASDTRFDLSRANVLYVTDFGGWNVHVFVEYNGYVYDPSITQAKKVRPVRAREYFARERSKETSKVRVIPGEDYLKLYNEDDVDNVMGLFWPGYDASEARQSGYPTYSLSDYLRGISD